MTEKNQSCAFRTSIGGQALIEGIMMRGPKKQAIVVRTEDGLVNKVEDLKLIKDRYPILGWPLVRGVVNFVASMVEGVKALTYSAGFLPEDEQEQPSKFDLWVEKKLGGEKAEKVIIGVSVVLGIAIAIGLFVLLPTFLAGLIDGIIKLHFVRSLVEGAIRIILFLAYLILVSKMKDIKRVWQYHGAEHKTIACYESGEELTVENCRTKTRLHPRCGTSFLFLVMIVSILVFSLVTATGVLARMALRVVLLPVVVAIAYELIKYAGRHDNWFTRLISAPGKALQLVTTQEPEDDMLEVAIAALKLVLPETEGEDKW